MAGDIKEHLERQENMLGYVSNIAWIGRKSAVHQTLPAIPNQVVDGKWYVQCGTHALKLRHWANHLKQEMRALWVHYSGPHLIELRYHFIVLRFSPFKHCNDIFVILVAARPESHNRFG